MQCWSDHLVQYRAVHFSISQDRTGHDMIRHDRTSRLIIALHSTTQQLTLDHTRWRRIAWHGMISFILFISSALSHYHMSTDVVSCVWSECVFPLWRELPLIMYYNKIRTTPHFSCCLYYRSTSLSKESTAIVVCILICSHPTHDMNSKLRSNDRKSIPGSEISNIVLFWRISPSENEVKSRVVQKYGPRSCLEWGAAAN